MEKLARTSSPLNLDQEFEGSALLTRWGSYHRVPLVNGATLHLSHIPNAYQQELRINVGSGSAMELPHQRGYAHFLEHVVLDFNRFDKQIRTYSRAQSNRLEYALNGSTRYRQTLFDATFPKKMEHWVIPAMVDRLNSPLLSGKELEREKSVVLAEMARASVLRYADPTPDIINALAPEYGVCNLILGTQESISGLSFESLNEFHRTHYGAGNMNIFYSGDLSGATINLLKNQLAGLRKGEAIPRPPPPRTLWDSNEAAKVLIAPSLRKEVEVVVVFPFPSSGEPDHPAAQIILGALDDPKLRLLFNEMRLNSGLVYSVDAERKTYDDFTPLFISFTLENADKIKPALMSLNRTLNEMRTSIIGQPEFASQIISAAIAGVNSRQFEYGRQLALEHALSGKIVLPDHKVAAMESLKAEDLERVAEKMFRDPFIYLRGRVSRFGDYSFG